MEALLNQKSVLCDPEGNVCINGSSEDRRIIQSSMSAIEQTIERQAAQIEMMRDGLKRADDLLRTSYDHVSPLIREALSTTPDQALEQFAERVRNQCFNALDPDKYPNECDKSMVHNCRLAICAIKELP